MYCSFEPGIDILLLDDIRYPSNATYNLSLEIGAMQIYQDWSSPVALTMQTLQAWCHEDTNQR